MTLVNCGRFRQMVCFQPAWVFKCSEAVVWIYCIYFLYLCTERGREGRVVEYIESTSHIVTFVHASRTMGAKLPKSNTGSRS